jgi:hypothetical protein
MARNLLTPAATSLHVLDRGCIYLGSSDGCTGGFTVFDIEPTPESPGVYFDRNIDSFFSGTEFGRAS